MNLRGRWRGVRVQIILVSHNREHVSLLPQAHAERRVVVVDNHGGRLHVDGRNRFDNLFRMHSRIQIKGGKHRREAVPRVRIGHNSIRIDGRRNTIVIDIRCDDEVVIQFQTRRTIRGVRTTHLFVQARRIRLGNDSCHGNLQCARETLTNRFDRRNRSKRQRYPRSKRYRRRFESQGTHP